MNYNVNISVLQWSCVTPVKRLFNPQWGGDPQVKILWPQGCEKGSCGLRKGRWGGGLRRGLLWHFLQLFCCSSEVPPLLLPLHSPPSSLSFLPCFSPCLYSYFIWMRMPFCLCPIKCLLSVHFLLTCCCFYNTFSLLTCTVLEHNTLLYLLEFHLAFMSYFLLS